MVREADVEREWSQVETHTEQGREQVEMSPSMEMLDGLAGKVDISGPSNRRMFVNRNLRFDRLKWVGFDMDYTLIRYHALPMGRLIYNKGVEKLMDSSLPLRLREELGNFSYDPLRVVRGTIVDKEWGNVFQMDRHRHIGDVFHGHRLLDKEERRRYRGARYSFTESDRFYLVDTLFSIPEVCLYCDVVEWFECSGCELPNWWEVFDIVRGAVDSAHVDESIHHAILGDLGKYIKDDPEIGLTLDRFRMSGKSLFLLTNSDWSYTDVVMEHLLGGVGEWKSFFDLVMVRAKKPYFFVSEEGVEYLDEEGNSLGFGEEIGSHRYLRGGNQKLLNDHLGADDGVLYVGDHIYGDILRTKKASPWRTMLIVEELESELDCFEEVREEVECWQELEALRDRLDDKLSYRRMLLERLEVLIGSPEGAVELEDLLLRGVELRRMIVELEDELDGVVKRSNALGLEIGRRFNPYWGMLFRAGHQISYLGEQIRDFACIYTSRVSNFLYYSPEHYFRHPRPLLPHERLDGANF